MLTMGLVFLALSACGGGAGNTKQKTPGAGNGDDGEQDSSGERGPQLPKCEDRSCVACGDTVCLPGYYCETVGGRSGCSWNAKCAKDATCGCLDLPDDQCRCEDRDGWAFVTCSP